MAIARDARARILDPRRYSVFPDVRPALAELSGRGWRHAVLSNNHPDLEPIVAALRLGHFEAVFTSALIGYEKPRREIFQYALERLAPTGPVWMIGDNEIADARGAEAAGLKAVLVRKASQGFHRSIPDLTSLPDLVHESVLADCE